MRRGWNPGKPSEVASGQRRTLVDKGQPLATITVAELLGRPSARHTGVPPPRSGSAPAHAQPSRTEPDTGPYPREGTAEHENAGARENPERGPGCPRRRRVVVVLALVVVVVAGLAIGGLRLHGQGGPSPDTVAQARQWLATAGSGSVVTDDDLRRQLLRAGFNPTRVRPAASCTSALCDPNWLLTTPALRDAASEGGPLSAALQASTPVAVFGAGDDRVEIRHAGALSADHAGAELAARTTIGRVLSRLPRIEADPGARAVMSSGRADPRLIAILATLSQRGPVQVLAFPAVAGEDAAGQPRRQLLLGGSDEAALRDFFAAQDDPYRPVELTTTPAGLLVGYPPLAPPNLLDAFEGR